MITSPEDVQLPFAVDATSSEPGAARALARCDELAKISALDTGVCRTYLTPEHQRCNELVQQWMVEAGMTCWQDQAGNCWGRYQSPHQQPTSTLILGSHLDTVVNAGKYDGILGVLSAIEVVAYFHRRGMTFPFAIEVVGFGDEEGTRFGATLLGSRAVAGTWDDRWFELPDKQGVSLASAMEQFGLSPSGVSLADRSGEPILAYLELHIEQGPVLEEMNAPVGIVTAIAGARRFIIKVSGHAGHAGTVPMAMRKDPLLAAAEVALAVEHIAKANNVVATVGALEAFPGAVNVIPGACEFSIDIRSGQDFNRDIAVEQIENTLKEICLKRGVDYHTEEIHNAGAVKCADWIQKLTTTVVEEQGYDAVHSTSGAGHDAMAFNGVADLGMIFVRCKGGVSHHPAESVTLGDVNAGLNVFSALIESMQ